MLGGGWGGGRDGGCVGGGMCSGVLFGEIVILGVRAPEKMLSQRFSWFGCGRPKITGI